MKAAGKPRRPWLGKIIAIAIIAAGVFAVINVERMISSRPATDDATIDADIVHVAAAVGGRIIELPVTENAKVARGDVLFRLDPVPYLLAVEQAEADLRVAEGALDTRRRAIATEKANAVIAREQIKRAQSNFELATRTAERLRPLAGKAYVSSSSSIRPKPPSAMLRPRWRRQGNRKPLHLGPSAPTKRRWPQSRRAGRRSRSRSVPSTTPSCGRRTMDASPA